MFGFGFDRRFIYILLGCLVLFSLINFSSGNLLAILFTLPAVIIAIAFHEYAHAWMADRLGDETPRMQGRLTLNPLNHLDPVGSILLLFAGFGWGKPVQINSRNFNRNVSMSKGEALVSLAGPVMNFILAIIFAIILGVVYMFAPSSFLTTTIGGVVYILLQECVLINIGLGVFNLIPLPPLDGSKILMHFLPYNAKTWFENNTQLFYIIFIVLWITNLISYIISPVIGVVSNGIYAMVSALFGIF